MLFRSAMRPSGLLRRFFGTSINYHQIARFDGDLAELHQSVRKFADEKVKPLAEKTERENSFPNQLWREFGEMGLLGVTTPAKYGGSELNYTAHSLIMEEISRASGAIGLSYGAHTALCLAQITRHGSEEQKAKYLPKVLSVLPVALLRRAYRRTRYVRIRRRLGRGVNEAESRKERQEIRVEWDQNVDHQRTRCGRLSGLRQDQPREAPERNHSVSN